MIDFLWKWLFCAVFHRKYRCFPTVWGPEQAKEMGIPYYPNLWHCDKCHPCGECFDISAKAFLHWEKVKEAQKECSNE